jgi:hypothetical protein
MVGYVGDLTVIIDGGNVTFNLYNSEHFSERLEPEWVSFTLFDRN